MNLLGINFESVADGEGVRVVVFVGGCLHNCEGCHNPSSHSFTAGYPCTEELQEEIIEYVRTTPYVSGMTLSGGDPLFSAKELIPFVKRFKEELPDSSIWVYTGFTFEEVMSDKTMGDLVRLCDVLVDGKFILSKRDITLAYRGSTNQRIIDIQESIKSGYVVEKEF